MTTRKLTPDEIADQQRGSTRLGPGLWRDRHGHLHVSLPELLIAFELEDTWANRTAVERIVREHWAAARPDVTLIRQEPE